MTFSYFCLQSIYEFVITLSTHPTRSCTAADLGLVVKQRMDEMTYTTEMLEIEAELSRLFRSGTAHLPKVEKQIDALFARHLELFREQRALTA